MIVSVHQPQYIPWLGFFHKVNKSDIYVSLDTVQYDDRGYIHRNKIKTPEGWSWLTIPVIYEHGCKINEVKINNNINWKEKHLSSLRHSYSNAPFFEKYYKELEKIYNKKWDLVYEFDDALLLWLFKTLGIKIKYYKLSELNVEGKSSLRIINICKKLKAESYFSGPGGKLYIREKSFKENKINLLYQEFEHPTYEQKFKDFIPGLSILDLLFNHGEKSLKIITGEKK